MISIPSKIILKCRDLNCIYHVCCILFFSSMIIQLIYSFLFAFFFRSFFLSFISFFLLFFIGKETIPQKPIRVEPVSLFLFVFLSLASFVLFVCFFPLVNKPFVKPFIAVFTDRPSYSNLPCLIPLI